jgi:hypothetical protein
MKSATRLTHGRRAPNTDDATRRRSWARMARGQHCLSRGPPHRATGSAGMACSTRSNPKRTSSLTNATEPLAPNITTAYGTERSDVRRLVPQGYWPGPGGKATAVGVTLCGPSERSKRPRQFRKGLHPFCAYRMCAQSSPQASVSKQRAILECWQRGDRALSGRLS